MKRTSNDYEFVDARWQPREDASDAANSPANDEAKPSTGSQSQSTALVAIGSQAELFHDRTGTTFARIEVGDHLEIWALGSKHFRRWLTHEYYKDHGKVPKGEAVSAARGVLDGMAGFDGAEHELHNRVAWHDGAIYYDLADKGWRAVRIDAEGWRVVDRPPILFRRYAHQLPQVEPASGDAHRVLEFLNVRPADQILLLAWLVTAMVPDIPHPIPSFSGDKGSGKSMGQRVLRRLIDPSLVETLSFPRDKQELTQQLDHHYAPVYDNLDGLSWWLSDVLCRAVTGEGFSKRQLYTDDEDVIYSYRRVVMLNGINIVAQRPDLLDRSLLLGLERIPKGSRRPEAKLWREFDDARPSILGGVFDALSAAIRLHGTLDLPQLERMADFTEWAAAAAEALGYGKDAFLSAYAENIGVQTREAVEGNLVGATIIALMKTRSEWSGTPTDLLLDLEEVGVNERLLRRTQSGKVDNKGWPGAPHILSRRINEVASNLADLDIVIERGDDRKITIRGSGGAESSVSSVGSVGEDGAATGSTDATDATDATLQTSTPVEVVIE